MNFIKKRIQENYKDQRNLWNFAKQIINKTSNTMRKLQLIDEGQVIEDSHVIANKFNVFFNNVDQENANITAHLSLNMYNIQKTLF